MNYRMVGFLQNAWFKPGTKQYTIDKYLDDHNFRARVLAMSSTGQKLIRNFGMDTYNRIWWENSTKKVGDVSSSCFSPDPEHILRVLVERQPEIVLGFGKNVEHLLRVVWSKSLFIFPHPKARVVTNQLFINGNAELIKCFTGESGLVRVAFRQKKGFIETEPLRIES